MKKYEFMNELERHLMEISYEERRDALRYYEDYFDEAGEENIDSVLKELGEPKKVAEKIKEDLQIGSTKKSNETVEHILASEKDLKEKEEKEKREKEQKKNQNENNYYYQSYENYEKEKYNNEKKDSIKGIFAAFKNYFSNLSTEKIIIIALAGIILVPVVFGLLGGIISLVFGIFFGLIGLAFGLFGGTIGLMVTGIIKIIVSIGKLAVSPAGGMVVLGTGIIHIALGLLFLIAAISICRNWLPEFYHWVTDKSKKLINDVKEWLNNGNI